jgi:hypothetical protein
MVLLCDHHHDTIHHHDWEAEFGKDGHPTSDPTTMDRSEPNTTAQPLLAPPPLEYF